MSDAKSGQQIIACDAPCRERLKLHADIDDRITYRSAVIGVFTSRLQTSPPSVLVITVAASSTMVETCALKSFTTPRQTLAQNRGKLSHARCTDDDGPLTDSLRCVSGTRICTGPAVSSRSDRYCTCCTYCTYRVFWLRKSDRGVP